MRIPAPALLLLVACGGGAAQPKAAPPAPPPLTRPAPPPQPVAEADAGPPTPVATPAVAAAPNDLLFQIVTATSLVDGSHQEMVRTIALFERLGLTVNGVLDTTKMPAFTQAYGDWARAHVDWIATVSGPGAADAFLSAHEKDPLPPWAP